MKQSPSVLITRIIYHFRCERRRNLLPHKIVPVNGGEEVMHFDLILIWENKKAQVDVHVEKRGPKHPTYKIMSGAQPVCAVLLQQTLQEGPGCAGRTGAHPQRLVENVVVHFMRVSAIEWWLRGVREVEARTVGNNNRNTTVQVQNSPIQRAFHTKLNPDTTSPLCCHTAASSAPQELNTVEEAHICHPTGLGGNT